MSSGPTVAQIPVRAISPISLDAVPAELRELKQWVVWRYEMRPGGKATKVPYATNGDEASSTDPGSWSTFDNAVRVWRSSGGDYSGIGFTFAAGGGMFGVDLDGCIGDTGTICENAKALLGAFSTYAEISPSGKGIKLFCRGTLPTSKGANVKNPPHPSLAGIGGVEIYSQSRYFTVTGSHLAGHPATLADCSEAGADLLSRLAKKPREAVAPAANTKPSATAPRPTKLPRLPAIDRCRMYVRKLPDAISGQGGHARTLEAACSCFRFGLSMAEAAEVMAEFNETRTGGEPWSDAELQHKLDDAIRLVTEAGQVGCKLDESKPAKISDGQRGPRRRAAAAPSDTAKPSGQAADDDRPQIVCDTDEHRVIEETIAALASDTEVFQRGSMLVRVLRSRSAHPKDGVDRPEGSPVISQLPMPNLRERMVRVAKFVKETDDGELSPVHPPSWLTPAVDCRGEWPDIQYLAAISDAPVLRPDGSIFQESGHDPATGVLCHLDQVFPVISEHLDGEDAWRASEELLSVVCDFRFEAPEHRSAWLAGLLTPLARYAFAGPSPMHLIDANVMGAGKGLLAQTIGAIVLGREMPVSSYAHDSDEMRKRLTAIAMAGDRMILMDNVEGPFGNDALDRALTCTRWKDRVLGQSREVDLPLTPGWYATGNNIQVMADTTRRVIHIRLDVLEEHPEHRSDFQHPDLLAWVKVNRPRLLTAGLTILAAFIRSGRPTADIPPFGSFEGWSALVRQAVVWIGLPDPCLTRAKLVASADTTSDNLGQLLQAWEAVDWTHRGVTANELLASLYGEHVVWSDARTAMRSALEAIVGTPAGRAPTPRQIGYSLRKFRRRVIAGKYIDTDPERGERGMIWRLYDVSGSKIGG